jgi:hypothetical protein
MSSCVVIGSSPLAIMFAIKCRNDGKNVSIIHSKDDFGGAWKKAWVKDVGFVECACHLIELNGNAYRVIEKLTGIRFKPFKYQPIRINKYGKKELYTSRYTIIKFFLRNTAILIILSIIRFFFLPYKKNISLKQIYKDTLFKLNNNFFYMFKFQGLEVPKGGYEFFVYRLSKILKKKSIKIIKAKVNKIKYLSNNYWNINLDNGNTIKAKKIFITESVFISKSDVRIKTQKYKSNSYWHILVSVRNDYVCKKYSYVHLSEDTIFHRITLIKPRKSQKFIKTRTCFLIESRIDVALIEDIKKKLNHLLNFCGFINSNSDLVIHKLFKDKLVSTQKNAQFIPGRYLESLCVIKSIGDLSNNIMYNINFLK